jgi:hypothetical protein
MLSCKFAGSLLFFMDICELTCICFRMKWPAMPAVATLYFAVNKANGRVAAEDALHVAAALLATMGTLLRARRIRLGLSLPEAAKQAGVSTRLCSETECGELPALEHDDVGACLRFASRRLDHPHSAPKDPFQTHDGYPPAQAAAGPIKGARSAPIGSESLRGWIPVVRACEGRYPSCVQRRRAIRKGVGDG